MNLYQSNLEKMLKYANIIILAHIPIFLYMAKYFNTEVSIAVIGPLLLLFGQIIFPKLLKNISVGAVLMGFSSIALSGIMIHLGKGMIEWHFHIFVTIGVLSLLATPLTIVAAALTAAVHHIAFYFILPESIFNYEASFGIVIIHALFVVVESVACTILAYRFKHVLDLQDQINNEISPLVGSIENASRNSHSSCSNLLSISDKNTNAMTEISSTSEQITHMVQTTKNQINKALESMDKTKASVEVSSKAITEGEEFVQSLNKIQANMKALQETSSTQLKSVVESVNTISDKTNIITDIVFQTKLLSFNASVEAARAGEHGKGFSVVAEEIGNLASNSGTASEDINNIVNKSKDQLNSSVESITDNLSNFQTNIEAAFNTWTHISETLSKAFTSLEETSVQQASYLEQISEAANDQSHGVHGLTASLSEIKDSTHQALQQIQELENVVTILDEDSEKLSKINKKIAS